MPLTDEDFEGRNVFCFYPISYQFSTIGSLHPKAPFFGVKQHISVFYFNDCQKSLEHLGHFYMICISTIAIRCKYSLIPETMLILKFIVPAFQQSCQSSCHPNFFLPQNNIALRERGKLQNKAKLAGGVPRLLAGIVGIFST